MSKDSNTDHDDKWRSILEGDPPQKFTDGWRLADGFTLLQAAHLWVGFEPPEKYKRIQLPVGFAAALQMLLAAARMGKLKVFHEYSFLDKVSEDDFVTRDDLRTFAESKKEYPSFLFYTSGHDIATNEQSAGKTNRGGRPLEYNWDRVIAGLILLNQDEIIPSTLSETADKMLEFVANGYSFEPSAETDFPPDKSLMEKHLRGIYTQFNSLRLKKIE